MRQISASHTSEGSQRLCCFIRFGYLMYDVRPYVCLLQKDLVHTIGESAALGAAGFVIWGDLNLTTSRVNCLLPLMGQKTLVNSFYFSSVKLWVFLCSGTR